MNKLARLLICVAMAGSMPGQGEHDEYFALSTSRTFGFQTPGAKPSVFMNGWNVESLDFRVYRINDPKTFFQQLERAHQWGGRGVEPPHQKTPLETLRAWKRTLHANIRRSLRAQFSESPSSHLKSLLPQSKTAAYTKIDPADAARFAEAPLLNPQQLVMAFTRRVGANSRWDREEVPIPVDDKGVYLVEAVHHELRAYTILFVSDLAMVSKIGRGRILNFVVDRRTGQPVAGIEVEGLSGKNGSVSAVTDRDGAAELSEGLPHIGETTLIARNGRDYAVNSVDWEGVNTEDWVGYIYTERPVYRPGHTVHFKALLRLRSGSGYDVPAGRKVSVEIMDPEQKPVYRKTLTVSPGGAVYDDLMLAPGAALGDYFIQVKAIDSEFSFMSGDFDVEDYRKPEYEVRVTPAKTRVLEGESVQVVIDARYFFGEPVSGGKVKYSIYRSRYWFPLWYDPDDESNIEGYEGDEGSDNSDYAGDQLTDQDGVLDADGKLTITVATAQPEKDRDYVYRVEARVTDAANREVAGRFGIVATYAGFALNVTPERYVYEPGSTATVTIQARDYDMNPVRTHVHVDLLRWTYLRVERRGDEKLVSSTEVDLDPNGDARTNLRVPNDGGEYLVRASARAPEGRNVSADTFLWITGANWARQEGGRDIVTIVPDRKTYKAGDTARLMIAGPPSGSAVYVTIEGRDITQHKLIRTSGSTSTFEFPVDARYEPGATISVISIKDGSQWNGTRYIRIPPVSHELKIKMATDKPQYLPGDSANYSMDVTDNTGKPVAGAELSLGVVDEAVYGVRPDTTPEILKFFFGHQYNRVITQNSLDYYFTGQAGKRRMQLAELRPASRLAQLKPERLVQPKIRKAFPDTAFWAPTLVTDSGGHAHAKVEYPDSLTTWRATARGITAATSVGSATLKTVVRKNLILRLTTPRFLVRGDEITISALVHNYLPTQKTARVSLDVQGLDLLAGKTQDVTIPSRGEVKVDWRFRAQQTSSATVTGKALTDEESDALEISFPVDFSGVKLSSSKGGSISGTGAGGRSAEFEMSFPENIEPGSRSLSIRVAPSITGTLFGALEYLTSFPYGCVEQTMSGFLPDIVVKDAVQSLGLKTQLNEASLQEKIAAGLDRLYNFQHPDGGWGWWETDDSHPFMTAYVVAGLVQARNTGTAVKQAAIDKGAQWLEKEIASDSKLTADFRAYLVYALTVAGGNESSRLTELYEKRSNLTPYGMALLGLALENAKDRRAPEVASALEASVHQNDEEAWWQATRDPMLDFDVDASPEATAFVMRFLSHEKKDSPLLPKAALWLVNHRNEGYWWSSTKQTAMVIYGLTDYLKTTNELNPNLNVTVLVNDRPALTRKLDLTTSLSAPDLVLDESKLEAGVNRIRIMASGDGRVYYGARTEYYSSAPRFEKTGTTSLNLLRDYFRLVPAKKDDRIVYDLSPLTGSVAPGDIVAVRLTATGTPWKYVMLEDPIPAGTEFIEKDDLYELNSRPPWWNYFFSRREMHDDHMAIFQTWFEGQHDYFYLLKVVNPGMFTAPPARIGPMYQPGVMATTESRRLGVN